MSAELVLRDAKIITMTSPKVDGRATALAIEAGRIVALGTDKETEALVGPTTRVIDLAGKSVLPGFIDAHVHLMQTGLSTMGPDLGECSRTDEVLNTVDSEVRGLARGEPLFLHRCALHRLDRPLSMSDLDRVAPDNPVAVGDVGLHSCVINSRGWQLVGLSTSTSGVEVQAEGAGPTGLLTDRAHVVARSHFYNLMGPEKRLRAMHVASRAALRKGITTVHAIEQREAFGDGDVELLLSHKHDLPVRTVVYYQTRDLERAIGLDVSGVADVWADGSYASHTAALLEPYADDAMSRGMLVFGQDELIQFVSEAHRQGLQVGLHAIGDAAIEQALNAYEYTLGLDSSPRTRHRIEHFSLPTELQIQRAARLGVPVVMQPVLSAAGENDLANMLGPVRASRRHPYRKIVDAGVVVAGSSDSDFTLMNPLLAIHSLVNHPLEQRRLTTFEALALFTVNGAWCASEEGSKGTIEPGKLADLVVLGENPLTVDPRRLKDIPVEMAIVGGEIVHDLHAPQPGGGG